MLRTLVAACVAAAVVVALTAPASRAGRSAVFCSARQLLARAALQGEAGHDVGGISVRNVSRRRCRLPVRPRVALFWRTSPLRVDETTYAGYEPTPQQRLTRQLGPGRWSFVPLSWSNWCHATPWGRQPFRPYLRVTIGSETMSVYLHHPSLTPTPPCLGKGPSVVEVGRFYTPLPVGWTP
jgi:hypothetical protein